ncbi:Methyltransferase domain-containing protein [Flavobacterium anhuiense]|uniref:Methyltransferase domain-containing protein n=1 Tax=Flavobacterium anhuiense TaxID=459526 RepID=A0ABY0LX38_9FLAO|nr:methyltransferase domain-containing protein [Flavobacterium anhuiense]SCY75440.1 Methyltransferase domain-containing protein [Flavobacterium anhuiense]
MLDMYRMFVKPEGKWGERGASMMVGLGNTMAIQAVELLGLAPTDHTLEIGFGPGIGLQALANALPEGTVTGIDPSDLMQRLATERNVMAIDAGRISLIKGTASHLPFNDNSFNGALAMDNMLFWEEPLSALNEVYRVLMPGAKLVCSFTPFSGGGRRGWPELFAKAGFVDFHISEHKKGFFIIAAVPK